MPAQCLGSLFGRSHVANCLKTSRWKVNFSPRGTLAFCSKRSSNALSSNWAGGWMTGRFFFSKYSCMPLPDWSFPHPNGCSLQKYPARFGSFKQASLHFIKVLKKKKGSIVVQPYCGVNLLSMENARHTTFSKNTQSTVSHNHATVLSPLSLSCFLWFFF